MDHSAATNAADFFAGHVSHRAGRTRRLRSTAADTSQTSTPIGKISPSYSFVSALNEQTNIAEARITALRNHDPIAVLFTLAIVAMVSLGFAGYAAGLSGFQPIRWTDDQGRCGHHTYQPHDRSGSPNRGSIEISKQPLLDALTALPKS